MKMTNHFFASSLIFECPFYWTFTKWEDLSDLVFVFPFFIFGKDQYFRIFAFFCSTHFPTHVKHDAL